MSGTASIPNVSIAYNQICESFCDSEHNHGKVFFLNSQVCSVVMSTNTTKDVVLVLTGTNWLTG